MAGKHTGAYDNGGTPVTGFRWDDRTAKAYAEGRAGSSANGHQAGTEASIAWIAGDARKAVGADQHETPIT